MELETHPTTDEIERYSRGGDTDAELVAKIESHLLHCSECARLVNRLVREHLAQSKLGRPTLDKPQVKA